MSTELEEVADGILTDRTPSAACLGTLESASKRGLEGGLLPVPEAPGVLRGRSLCAGELLPEMARWRDA